MHLTLIESDRNILRTAEYATLSIVAHIGIVCLALATTTGTFHLPADEREARAMFLLPPDQPSAPTRQIEVPLPGRPGSGLDQASQLPAGGEGQRLVATESKARNKGDKSGAKGDQPFGPPAFLPERVYSALQVDQMVERYAYSAAPIYPPSLSARGVEGLVDATYVVDTTGRVDTSTIKVLQSADSLFTESVRTALGQAAFRPAKRGGRSVRQLVAQRFRFELAQSQTPLQGN